MHSDNSNGSRAAWARGIAALFAMLAMGLGLLASAAAAPFAYVPGAGAGANVYVIDTATHPPSVVAAIPVGSCPLWVGHWAMMPLTFSPPRVTASTF